MKISKSYNNFSRLKPVVNPSPSGDGMFNSDGTTTYKYERGEFTTGEILSNDWEVTDAKINPKK